MPDGVVSLQLSRTTAPSSDRDFFQATRLNKMASRPNDFSTTPGSTATAGLIILFDAATSTPGNLTVPKGSYTSPGSTTTQWTPRSPAVRPHPVESPPVPAVQPHPVGLSSRRYDHTQWSSHQSAVRPPDWALFRSAVRPRGWALTPARQYDHTQAGVSHPVQRY